MGALLAVLLGRKGGFGVPTLEDGADVVGAEGGERAQNAGVDEVHQGVEFLGGREGGRVGGSVDGRVTVSFLPSPPSLPPSLPPNHSAPEFL